MSHTPDHEPGGAAPDPAGVPADGPADLTGGSHRGATVETTGPATSPDGGVATAAAVAPAGEGGRGRGSLARDILGGSAVLSVLAVVVALVIGAIIIAAIDTDVRDSATYFFARPGDTLGAAVTAVTDAYAAMFRGAIFDYEAESVVRQVKPITDTLFYAVPLTLAGLGLAVTFRAGLFNIGAQGQIVLGAMAAGYVGFTFQLPFLVHLLLAIAGAAVAGAMWAGIAGGLKARTGANEVIVTIMLNSVAGLLLAYALTQDAFQVPGSNEPRSPAVYETAEYPLFFDLPLRLHFGLLLALLAVVFVWWLLERSTFGFELRATGANPHAALNAGISTNSVTVATMAVSGALCGMAGSAQVLGDTHYLSAGVAGTIGFDAITVALLGRSRPVGTLIAGILFGAFKAGSFAMARVGVPVDIVLVVQSVIVLLIAAPPLVRWLFRLPTPGAGGRTRPRRRRALTPEVTA